MNIITDNIVKNVAQSLVVAFAFTILVAGMILLVQPAQLNAATQGSNVTVNLQVNSELTLNCDSSASGGVPLGLSQDTSTSGATCTVKTSDAGGYTLTVENDDSNPAMQDGSNSFADYTDSGSPEAWSVASGNYEFGFSAFGPDTSDSTYGNGSNCNGSNNPANTNLLYRGFDGTNPFSVASSGSPTPTAGAQTHLCFGAEQSGVNAPSGNYKATIVVTATTN